MRLVVDTNVFVSAVLKVSSQPFRVVRWVDQHAGLLKSLETERQLMDVLARPHIAAVTIPSFRADLVNLIACAELLAISERITACRNPTDDKFLKLAVCGRANMISTGDADLLALNPFRGIPIITPAAFVQRTGR
jgi:uncharacterized protein